MKKIITILCAAVAISVGLAAPANAYTEGEAAFLSALHEDGFDDVFDYPRLWISSAYDICNRLNYTTGDVVASWLATVREDGSYEWAFIFMVDAVENLCPWHDHRSLPPLQRAL